eukprot:CAMPEP_0197536810 /NCGR_PEP_ID=MMETSP1318-20131121/54902_1 /TAXON_ID=552666 /ORGANISM="Partenskyella glossopodia, Strain RCC365" /LENGTH=168 /DNA_ID=CAMNT_0043094799 /DNA_START=112 /DNA_END=615 /DNA_ORIENTATION=+
MYEKRHAPRVGGPKESKLRRMSSGLLSSCSSGQFWGEDEDEIKTQRKVIGCGKVRLVSDERVLETGRRSVVLYPPTSSRGCEGDTTHISPPGITTTTQTRTTAMHADAAHQTSQYRPNYTSASAYPCQAASTSSVHTAAAQRTAQRTALSALSKDQDSMDMKWLEKLE